MYNLNENFGLLSKKYQINEIGIGSKIKKIVGKASGINTRLDRTTNKDLGFKKLHAACMKSDYNEVKNIIEWGGDPNATDNNGNTAIHILCGLKNVEDQNNLKIFNLLLDNGADINAENSRNITPIYLICKTVNTKFMEVLIKNKLADLDDIYEEFLGAKSSEILELLLKNGLNINKHYDSIMEYIKHTSITKDYRSPASTSLALPKLELACEILDLLEKYGFAAKTSKDEELIDFIKTRTKKEQDDSEKQRKNWNQEREKRSYF